MDNITDPFEIKEDIENNYKTRIYGIYKLKNTQRGLFLVVMDSTITLKFLNKNVQYIYHTKVQWELRRNITEIIQCLRCQCWGHTTINCHVAPACLKSAGQHWTKECTLVKKDDSGTAKNIKCKNCSGAHFALDKECSVLVLV